LRKEPTIVLVKYGKVFRGLKVKAAQEAGAIGCLIYSDPGDDGEKTIKNGHMPYPKGPARQPSSVQRGSVQFLSSYPGDPSTPGYPAYKNASRVPGGNFPAIPSLPISYEDALPLLRMVEGHGRLAKEVGADWEGGLTDEVEYWTGPSQKDVRFVNEVDTKETPIWSVFAYIPGHIKVSGHLFAPITGSN
jgi:N-acetylated-alpha-linked acidic dipeptidase